MTSRFNRLSIRTQLLLLIAAFAIPVIAIAVWSINEEIKKERAVAFEKVSHVNDITANRIGQILTDHEVLLRLVAAEFSGSPPTKSPRFDTEQFLRMHPQIINIGVRDLAANNIYSHLRNPKPPEEALKFPWLQRGIASDRFEAGDAFPGSLSSRWTTHMTYPITDSAGRRTGFAYLSIDLLTLNNRVKKGLPDGYLLAVFDSRFNFLMRSEHPEQWIGKPLKPELANLYRGSNESLLKAPNVGGISHLWSFTRVPHSNWIISVGVPEDAALAPIQSLINKSLFIGLVLLVIMVAVSQILAGLIAKPVLALASAAAKVGKGDLAYRAADDGPTEISAVVKQFNAMLDSLDQQRRERDALADHYATLIKAARDIILLIDDEGRIVEANDAAVHTYGYTLEELRNLNIRDLRTPASRLTMNTDWHKTAQRNGILFEAEHCRRDGSIFPVEVSSRAFDIGGKMFRQSFVRDITERKHREQNLSDQVAELRRWQQAMLDRESRITELKQQINKLLIAAGQPPRYSDEHLNKEKPADE
jgi:PAS domain S-box-containing protein